MLIKRDIAQYFLVQLEFYLQLFFKVAFDNVSLKKNFGELYSKLLENKSGPKILYFVTYEISCSLKHPSFPNICLYKTETLCIHTLS